MCPTAGNPLGRITSDETRKRMSEAKKGRIYRSGFKHSIETRAKLSQSRKNLTPSRKSNKWPHTLGCHCKCDNCREKSNEMANKRKKEWRLKQIGIGLLNEF